LIKAGENNERKQMKSLGKTDSGKMAALSQSINQEWEKLKISLSLLCSIEWSGVIFFLCTIQILYHACLIFSVQVENG